MPEPASIPSAAAAATDRPLSFAEVLRDELAAIDRGNALGLFPKFR